MYSARGKIFNNVLYIPLMKGQAYSLETAPSSHHDIRTITASQDELIGGKPPVTE
jgi:hypothetical protein